MDAENMAWYDNAQSQKEKYNATSNSVGVQDPNK
jgi:hypothetical protein